MPDKCSCCTVRFWLLEVGVPLYPGLNGYWNKIVERVPNRGTTFQIIKQKPPKFFDQFEAALAFVSWKPLVVSKIVLCS